MAGRVAGKVALITGAGRGQGRSHAERLAREGADIMALDWCTSFETISYPMATPEDLAETARLVEKAGRRVIAVQADVRDPAALQQATARAVTELGSLDVVVANAGICAMDKEQPLQAWADVSGVNLGGVLNTLNAAIPHLKPGGSLIATGSLGALLGVSRQPTPGGIAYNWSKRTLVSLVHDLAVVLAPREIRVNGIHPTSCNTPMLQHEAMYRSFLPEVEHPTLEDAIAAFPVLNAMPTPWVEPSDISNVVTFLASDESRWVTGQFIACDAGGHLSI